MTAAVTTFGEDLLDVEENNNVFLHNLKPVFEACDHNGDGYVKVQDLIDLGQQYTAVDGTSDELSLILKQLDANGDGRITFEEFSEKVPQLVQASPRNISGENMECSQYGPVKIVFSEEENRARSYTDSEGFFEENDIGSDSTTSMNDFCGDLEEAHSTPHGHRNFMGPSSYFDRIKRNSIIYSTYPPNGKRPRKAPPSLCDLQRHQLSRTSEYQSQEENSNWDSDFPIQISENQSGLSNQRLSGNGVAHRLREVQSARNSLHGSMEEMGMIGRHHSLSEGEGDFVTLSEEIKKLSSQVLLMKINQDSHNDKQKKIREENRMLINRINVLEEQLIDQKNNSLEAVEVESQKYQKQLIKIQREHVESIDELQMKVHEAELEIESLKSVEPMLKKELEINLEERRVAHQKIELFQKEILEKEKEIEQLKYKLKAKTEELERERSERTQEVLLLSQEIENLKYMQNAALNQYDERNDLMKKMELLRKDNDDLKHSQDELRNQLLEKRSSLELKEEKSLADELVTADKCDVLSALRGQEQENHRLRQYIDQLLIMIMQTDPLLLEK